MNMAEQQHELMANPKCELLKEKIRKFRNSLRLGLADILGSEQVFHDPAAFYQQKGALSAVDWIPRNWNKDSGHSDQPK